MQSSRERYLSEHLVFVYRKGSGAVSRMGVTVSKRVAKQAVRRNRVKRWLREAFRRLDLCACAEPVDVVIIARPSVLRASFREVRQEVEGFWEGLVRTRRGGC